MNLKQTMKFPLETPGQKKMKGKAPQGELVWGFFFFSEPKTCRENKPTHLQSTPGARGGQLASVLCWQRVGHTCVARAHACEQGAATQTCERNWKSGAHTCRGGTPSAPPPPRPRKGAELSSLLEDEGSRVGS